VAPDTILTSLGAAACLPAAKGQKEQLCMSSASGRSRDFSLPGTTPLL